jgi:hypothetical protein
MKQKITIILCIILICLSGTTYGANIENVKNYNFKEESDNEIEKIGPIEVVDQKQLSSCGQGCFFFSNYWLAQSFIPSLSTLTKVQVRLFKAGNPPNDIELSIRSSLVGSDLTTSTVDGAEISTSSRWIDFDFPDISVNPGSKYYLVCRTVGGSALNYYCAVFDINNPYESGEAWGSQDSGSAWEIIDNPIPGYPEPDACFKTYGLDEAPFKPTINGETYGKLGTKYSYTISTTDPENHDLFYLVDWGDGTNSGWVGPYNSGSDVVLSHTWTRRGINIIKVKAKDMYDLESCWANISVNMPKNRIPRFVSEFFEHRIFNIFSLVYIFKK